MEHKQDSSFKHVISEEQKEEEDDVEYQQQTTENFIRKNKVLCTNEQNIENHSSQFLKSGLGVGELRNNYHKDFSKIDNAIVGV